MSTKPGVTSAPAASTTRAAEPLTSPTSTTTPSRMATSAVRAAAPVPSTTVPPLMTTSNSGMFPSCCGHRGESRENVPPWPQTRSLEGFCHAHPVTAEFWTMGVGLPKVAVRQAERAEASGWDGLLLVDSQNLAGDCYIGLALAAHATSTLQLATGVTNPFTRHPAVTAGAIATVQAESDGRAVLGIGRGDSSLAHVGLAPAPVAVFERYVRQVQRYLRGEDVPLEEAGAAANTGTVPPVEELHLAGAPDASRLHWLRANQPKVPVDVAATGPKVIGVAGRHADRVTFAVGADPERVAWAIDTFRAARAAAGLPADDGVELGAYVNVVCHPDRDT